MSDGRPRSAESFRRLLRRPWFAAVAGVVAVCLVATVGVVAVSRFTPRGTAPALAEPVPSAFPVSLNATSSPAVDRGETVSLRLQAATAVPPETVEIWQDATLLMRIADPPYRKSGGAQLLDLALDVVATQAGQHHLSARIIDRRGAVGQTITIPTAVLDLPSDVGVLDLTRPASQTASGPWEFGHSEFSSIPGDTLASIAGRLAVPVELLLPLAPLPSDVDSPTDVIPAGTRMYAPIASSTTVASAKNFVLPTSTWVPQLKAKVSGCDVVVSSTGYSQEVALYSGPELRRVGEVAPGSSTTIAGLPVGGNVIVGYLPGAKPSTSGQNGPSKPVAVTLPDACGSAGWTGDVRIVNGVLSSALTAAPPQPYLYVSLDGGRWSRFPAAEGEFLPAADLVDVSKAAFYPGADQINVELWSGGEGTPKRVADGTFCRARIGLAKGAASPTACRPPENAPAPIATGATLSLKIEPEKATGVGGSVTRIPVAPATQSIALSKDIPVTLLATLTGASDATSLVLQYSYFPISGSSELLAPPGVFHEQRFSLSGPSGSRTASVTVNPWTWRNLSLNDDGAPTAQAGALDLRDELTRSTALQLLKAQGGIVRDVYLRVVAVRETGGYGTWTTSPVGVASAPVHIDLGADFPEQGALTLGDPAIEVDPGRVTPALAHDSLEVSSDRCVTVQSYPDAGTWEQSPSRGPQSGTLKPGISREEYDKNYAQYYGSELSSPGVDSPFATTYAGYPARPGDILIQKGSIADTDLERAKFSYPNADWAYCFEGRPAAIDAAEAGIKAAAKEAAKCTFVCVVQAVLVGALVGFAYGGPYGAIVGAAVGLTIGLTHALAPEIYATLFAFWDKIASIYNGIYSAIGKLVDTLACKALQEASSKVGSVCSVIASSALAVVWSVYVGTPPYIPTSAVLERIAKGSIEDLIFAAISAAGVPCASLTVSGGAATGIREVAGQAGVPSVDKALEASREEGSDDISVCRAVSRIIADQAQRLLTSEHGAIMSSIYQTVNIPGLVLAPYAATSPSIQLTVPAKAGTTTVTECPVVGSMFLRLKGRSLQIAPTETTLTRAKLGGFSFGDWKGTLNVPVPWYFNQSWSFSDVANRLGTIRTNEPATAGQSLITLNLSSPCFSDVYTLQLDGFDDFNEATAATDAYYQDDIPIARYYPGYGLTSKP